MDIEIIEKAHLAVEYAKICKEDFSIKADILREVEKSMKENPHPGYEKKHPELLEHAGKSLDKFESAMEKVHFYCGKVLKK